MTKSKKPDFRPNEFVVYPAHGVGRIISIEEQEIAGLHLELFVICTAPMISANKAIRNASCMKRHSNV